MRRSAYVQASTASAVALLAGAIAGAAVAAPVAARLEPASPEAGTARSEPVSPETGIVQPEPAPLDPAAALQEPAPPPSAPAAPATPAPRVRLLEIDGVINPLSARYLERELGRAADDGVDAVLLRLDTPGGLETSMRQMVEAILASPVPVIVYVAPAGARAASAGMFLTIAAHVAAMAPGTNIGAAHPVGIGGAADTVAVTKVVNDAAALARSIAATRGRNAEWAERAVRESVSITAGEAQAANVIDLVVADRESLLRSVHGRRVATPAGPVALRTAGARLEARPMSFAERVLQTITDPNIAYVLFTIGIIGLIAELYNPGMLFPGITGGIALVLAFVAFGSLPVNWAGVLLLVVGVGLLVAELYSEGIGVLAAGGVVAFVLGSLMLYSPAQPTSPAMPEVRVSPVLVAVMAATVVGFFVLVVRALLRIRRAPVATGTQALLGRAGVAVTDLAPDGTVRLGTETWTATAEGEPISAGAPVEVVAVEGVILRVRPRGAPHARPEAA